MEVDVGCLVVGWFGVKGDEILLCQVWILLNLHVDGGFHIRSG